MQRKALTIAVAAALTAVAGSASAAHITDSHLEFGNLGDQYNSGNTTVVFVSGSSATNNQTKSWAEKVLCQANIPAVGATPAVRNQVTWNRVGDSNNFAVVCKPKTTFTGFTKPYVAVVKNSTGGSGNGVTQLLTTTPSLSRLTYMNVFQSNPQTAATSQEVTTRLANIGVADEEAEILQKAGAITLPSGVAIPNPASPLNVVTFGTPVTLGLYHALVDSQINSGKISNTGSPVCRTGSGPTAVYSYVESCMPSLSQSQISSIFSGNLVGWKEIFNQPGDPIPADDTVHIARRVVTSGTQTAARIHFLNEPCADNLLPFVAGNNGESSTKADACNATTPVGAVFEGSGSGNVSACLTNHQRNGRWAIGINSLELPSTTDTSPAYTPGGGAAIGTTTVLNSTTQRHIKIDGFAPTTFNTATGRYRFWFEAVSYQPRDAMGAVLNNPVGGTGAVGDVNTLRAAMDAGFNNDTVLSTLNSSFNTTVLLGAGKSAGILAPALTSTPPTPYDVTPSYATEANTTAKPEMYYTRSISGTANSCQPAMSLWATGLNP